MTQTLYLTATGGQDITPAERRRAVRSLAVSKRALLDAVKGLSEAQWKFQPGPGRWSVGEIVEDLALLEERVGNQILGQPGRARRSMESAALDRFAAGYARIAEILTSAPNLRGRVANHPVFGPLDGYEWILLVAAHTERHTEQILEVEADPGFPKHQD